MANKKRRAVERFGLRAASPRDRVSGGAIGVSRRGLGKSLNDIHF